MAGKGRNLKRKQRKETVSMTQCRFRVNSSEFLAALMRVSTMLVVDKIKPEDQKVVITANKDNTILVECGSSGSYCSVIVDAKVAKAGYFATNITIPQLRYGAEEVMFTTDPDNKKILYSSKIRGYFVSTATPDSVIRNRPKKEPDTMVSIPRYQFSQVYYTSYFNADIMEDNPDVLVRFDVDKLKKPFNVTSKQKMTHSIKVTVHDRHRAAFSADFCTAGPTKKASGIFQASGMWRFLKSCTDEEETLSIGTDGSAMWIRTSKCLTISPVVHGDVRDVETWASGFHDDESDFKFSIDTDVMLSALKQVASIKDKDPDSERRLKVKVKGSVILLYMESGIGSAEQKVQAHSGTNGSADIDADFLVNSLSLFKDNSPAFFTVWESAIRMKVAGDHKSTHFFSTMARQ